jgi:thiamine biosynthesis lipoprotein
MIHVEHVMGTVVSLHVRDAPEGAERAAVAAATAFLHEADARFSPYTFDSEVNRIERGELLVADAHPDVRAVVRRCADLSDETGGAFDVRARGRLDPSALVKGWAAERAAAILVAHGVADFCLNAGGDVVARGTWRVGVRHPHDAHALAAALTVTDAAVATSGLYERGAHLVDPRTGAAPTGVVSVTVAGPDLALADAYSTAAFALGADGPAWTLGLPARGYEALSITTDDRVMSTPGFPGARAAA